jgi:sirohydrochlorin ferrochelatase
MRPYNRLISVLGIALTAASAGAQQLKTGLLVVAHGGGPDWNQQILDVASAVRHDGPVRVSFLMGSSARERAFQNEVAALRAAGAARVVVVPLFISSHSEHMDQLRFLIGERESLDETMLHHLQMNGIERPADRSGLRLTAALDSAPELAAALAERGRRLADDRGDRALFLLGHGPNGAEDYAQWMTALRPVAEAARRAAGYRLAAVELVRDDAPPVVRAEAVKRARELVALMYAATNKPVVVVPTLVATGSISRVKLRADLEGLPVVYSGEAVLPGAGLARWVERMAATP